MGILETDKTPQIVSPAARRKSGALDFGSLKPLNAATGTKNFGGYRDTSAASPKSKVKAENGMDSDADDEDDIKVEDVDDDRDESGKGMLSPEDALKQGELAEGVRKIKVRFHDSSEVAKLIILQLKRQHSAEPLGRAPAPASTDSGSPLSGTPVPGISVGESSSSTTKPSAEPPSENSIASPFKKQRASLPGFDDNVRKSLGQALLGAQKERGNSEGSIPPTIEAKMEEDDEEL